MDGFSIFHPISNLLLVAKSKTAEVGAGDAIAEPENWNAYLFGATAVFAIFVLPFILSHFITKAIRMPSHSFRLGVMLAAIAAGFVFGWTKNFQIPLGPDMQGGTNLVYDILPDKDGQSINAGALASALTDRINPAGTKEILIRPRGEAQIEITVPNTDELELKKIKDLLSKSGQLEFRIVANTRDHQSLIELARQQAAASSFAKPTVTDADGKTVGLWFTVGREERKSDGVFPLKTPVLGDIIRDTYTGKLISNPPLDMEQDFALEKWMVREGVKDVDVLMSLEMGGKPYSEVSGDDLSGATTEFDKSGYVVSFRLNSAGANKMLGLTAVNQPDGNFHRRMAIIMDGKVLSAPQLNSPISSSGQITGNFTKEEVEFLVTILRSGRLPATLSDEPVSENRVGAGLGATTIAKGKNASIWAVVATFVAILLYYRFSGAVASMALLINGLLIFGIMIFIGQPLTLPGLAGLVLTVGMSVDANVLIFERIREEKGKGSAARMAIRNGFDRAFTTIIDSNLTTLIAAVVLYWIGTDQVRGFAVALIIGIMTSMFTATFCSRIVFEMAEKLKLVSLSMSDGVGFLKRSFLGSSDINFMGWQKACAAVSSLLVIVGLVAVFARGKDVLNIDFTGGTSVTFQLQEPLPAEELRSLLKKILTKDKDDKPVQFTLVRVEKEPADTVYTLVASIEDEKYLSQQLVEGVSEDGSASLKTYKVNVLSTATVKTGSLNRRGPAVAKFVSFQEESTPATQEPPTPPAAETPASETTVVEAISQETASPETPASETPALETTGTEAAGVDPAEKAEDENLATAVPATLETSEVVLQFAGSTDDNPKIQASDKGAKIDGETLRDNLAKAAVTAGVELNVAAIEVYPDPLPEDWRPDDIAGFSDWKVSLPVGQEEASAIVSQFQLDMSKEPLWLSLSKIGSRVAGEMQQRAIAAILLSLVFIVAYIWFRFQKVAYGLAAVVALVHDVLITLGVLALCHWLVGPLQFLLIEDFKIGLTEVAAFLTIIGYSLNDTIVVFDRIREVRGRSPRLTPDMVNSSVNQTLSRTLLTSGTTLLTVLLLYIFGGEGIHAFAFALLVGVLVGTYSSIFIAAPVLLWISNRDAANQRPGTTV